jgi:hypothetical protein
MVGRLGRHDHRLCAGAAMSVRGHGQKVGRARPPPPPRLGTAVGEGLATAGRDGGTRAIGVEEESLNADWIGGKRKRLQRRKGIIVFFSLCVQHEAVCQAGQQNSFNFTNRAAHEAKTKKITLLVKLSCTKRGLGNPEMRRRIERSILHTKALTKETKVYKHEDMFLFAFSRKSGEVR